MKQHLLLQCLYQNDSLTSVLTLADHSVGNEGTMAMDGDELVSDCCILGDNGTTHFGTTEVTGHEMMEPEGDR